MKNHRYRAGPPKRSSDFATSAAIALVPVTPAFADGSTATPIKHIVVIFQENVSFDHYFGTYPFAAHPGMITRINARFEGFPGRCHILEHEDNQMMRPYEIIAP